MSTVTVRSMRSTAAALVYNVDVNALRNSKADYTDHLNFQNIDEIHVLQIVGCQLHN